MLGNTTHTLFDLTAAMLAVFVSYYFRQHHFAKLPSHREHQNYAYLLVAICGLVMGSLVFGSLNLYLAATPAIGKSILGGLAGAIVSVELFKYKSGIKDSTGVIFVPGLTVAIVIGRLGCFLSGLSDNTYGVATVLPWGVDFGDGIARHPVQLYESAAMLFFLMIFWLTFQRYREFWFRDGFYVFVFYYCGQRFLWEFLKPYPTLWLSLNLFQLLSLALIGYASYMMQRKTHFHAQ